ncbi:MAG TPA: rhodanese-like domain-containing protein [Thermoanaerobaculia bacterium]|jgi:hydroxyacylglutathione hydrolase|nr:rhodanese-like domain-containing protein [Thermoanaerobaculia bacterium]
MLLERFEDRGLAHYSYAVGDEGARKVAIVDPRRDVDVYVNWAAGRGYTIASVLETHIHADFASGARELAARTGATLHLSAYDEGERYEVAFPHQAMREGDAVELGKVRLVALHTPGHTPEHLTFLVVDSARSATVPIAALTGDFLFVGALGRPDLLGEEAKHGLARALFRSVREKLAGLPDGLEVYPAHGAGSMCGAGMSSRPFSTLGFERIANPFLDPQLGEAAFVDKILAAAPPFPPYYLRMKELNAAGPPLLGSLPGLDPIAAPRFRELAEDGEHVVIDLRDQLAFGGGHLPRALGIGVDGGSLSTWAGWLVPYEQPLLLVAAEPADVEPAVRALVRVGLDGVEGWLEGGMERWIERGFPLETLPQLSVRELAAQRDSAAGNGAAPTVLDIRADSEWSQGHVAGAHHLMGGFVPQRLDEVPEGPLAVMCGGGYRSTAVASFLRRAGRDNVINVTGGMGAWKRAGLPLDRS